VMKRKMWMVVLPLFILTVAYGGMKNMENLNQKFEFLTILKHHSIVMTEKEDQFSIVLMTDRKNSMYTDPRTIRGVVLSDQNRKDQMMLHLISIQLISGDFHHQGKKYYRYEMTFKTDETAEHVHSFNAVEAILEIKYGNGEDLSVGIGSISLLKAVRLGTQETEQNHLRITRIKPIVDVIEGTTTMVAVVLGMATNEDIMIRVEKIELVSAVVSVNHQYLKQAKREFNMEESIWDVFESPYHPFFEDGQKQVDWALDANGTVMIVPISYPGKSLYVYEFGMIIHYRVNDESYRYVMGTFLFFETRTNALEVQVTIYERS